MDIAHIALNVYCFSNALLEGAAKLFDVFHSSWTQRQKTVFNNWTTLYAIEKHLD